MVCLDCKQRLDDCQLENLYLLGNLNVMYIDSPKAIVFYCIENRVA